MFINLKIIIKIGVFCLVYESSGLKLSTQVRELRAVNPYTSQFAFASYHQLDKVKYLNSKRLAALDSECRMLASKLYQIDRILVHHWHAWFSRRSSLVPFWYRPLQLTGAISSPSTTKIKFQQNNGCHISLTGMNPKKRNHRVHTLKEA